jgi:hypothetical protein
MGPNHFLKRKINKQCKNNRIGKNVIKFVKKNIKVTNKKSNESYLKIINS